MAYETIEPPLLHFRIWLRRRESRLASTRLQDRRSSSTELQARADWRRWKESNFHASVYETDALASLSYIARKFGRGVRTMFAPLRTPRSPVAVNVLQGMSHAPIKWSPVEDSNL